MEKHQGSLSERKKDYSDLHFFSHISARSCFWKPDTRFDGRGADLILLLLCC